MPPAIRALVSLSLTVTLAHWALTGLAWYLGAAAAQGVADGSGEVPARLSLLFLLREILLLPIAGTVLNWWPALGGFSLPSLAGFLLISLLNSAAIGALVAVISLVVKRGH